MEHNISFYTKLLFQPPNRSFTSLILGICIAIGVSGGYKSIADGNELMGKIVFSLYGLTIGLVAGFLAALIMSLWSVSLQTKWRVIAAFILGSTAPCLWVYLDFEEYSRSTNGLAIFLCINTLVIYLLVRITKQEETSLLPIWPWLLFWEAFTMIWFIMISWQVMDYWD